MKRLTLHSVSRLLLLGLMAFWLSACESGVAQNTTLPGATPTAAHILLGPQSCPDQARTPAYWAPFVHLAAVNAVESVSCGYLTGQPLLQAVVMVRSNSPQRQLALYVFTNLAGSAPTSIFSLTNMQAGEATISAYNTLLTSQQEWQPFQNERILHTLTREFKWSDSAQTLVQVGFVGLYPDSTRDQAEVTQRQVNASQGGRGWQLDAVSTAQFFAEFLLQWPSASSTMVVSGGGTHDTSAVVLVTNPALDHATIQVSLSRLELNTNGGIWEVTAVTTKGLTLTAPRSLQRITSPAPVTGSAPLAPGEHPVLAVLNEEHTTIGQKTLGPGGGLFRTNLTYTSPLFQGDVQEGVVALYMLTTDQQIAGCIMVKVLLQD
jgi:hypothetical protein